MKKKIGRFFRWLLSLLLITYTVLFALSWLMPVAVVESQFDFGRPAVIAHAGGDGLRPGNTLAAFEHAAELGVDVLEMDIHSTKDGVLVVIHDDTVDRTTDGSGRVQAFTLAELQQLDAGYRWPTDGEGSDGGERPFRGQGITIPALEEVMTAFPNLPLNIEIKQKEPSITRPLCEMLKKQDRIGENRVLVASFHAETITEFRSVCPDVPTSVVQNEVVTFFLLNHLRLQRLWSPPAEAFQIPPEFSGLTVITPRFVRNLQSHGVIVHPWTVNSDAELERMLRMGVDGIITDYPDKLMKIIEDRERR